jgi:hypothetical protein
MFIVDNDFTVRSIDGVLLGWSAGLGIGLMAQLELRRQQGIIDAVNRVIEAALQ